MNEVAEPINFITLFYNHLDENAFFAFLHRWDNILFSLLVAFLITGIFCYGAKKRELIPTGLQNFLELLADYLNSLVVGVLGPEGTKYTPFLGSLFVYILCMNLFGIIPLMKSPSANINITAAHAICVFILVQYLNIKNMGIKGFIYHMAGSPKDLITWIMVPLMLPIELITQLARPITLAFRLFGNIFGEDVLIGYFAMLGATLLPMLYPIGLPLQTPFLFLALLTSLMQALVFTLLTTVYILLSIPEAEEHA